MGPVSVGGNTNEGIFVIQDGIYSYVNEYGLKLFGREWNELVGAPILQDVHPDDREFLMERIQKRMAGKPVEDIVEHRIIDAAKGQIKWVETRGVLSTWEGRPASIGFATDITERKQAEEALKKSNTLLDMTGRMARVGGWELDPDTMGLTWSDETYHIHEVPFDYKLVLQEAIHFFHPEDRPKLETAIQRALEHGEPYDLEIRLITANEKHLWVRTKCEPVLADGKVVKLRGTFQDITERKRTERTLYENEEKYRSLFNQSVVGIYLHDLQGQILDVNQAGCQQVGYFRDELLQMNVFDLHPGERGSLNLSKAKILKQWNQWKPGYRLTLEAEHKRKDGALFTVEISTGVVSYADRWLILAFTKDITERRHAEQEKEKLESQLRQAQKLESIGTLAGGVAHDFNNMLSVILGNTELARAELDPSQPTHHKLQEIQKAAQRSSDVVRQLLAFARRQTISPKILDLNETVEEMLKMLRRLIGEDIDLSWQPDHDIWPIKVDPAQIDQILANLSINARDAINGIGKLVIATGKASFDEAYCSKHPGFVPHDFVLLTVSDTGCGMDKENLKNIFEPFFTTKEVGKGTGLGLATVYGIVKQNNGFINVYSEPNQGTTFKIYFPRHRTVDEPVRTENTDTSDAHGDETILLVEDEPAILDVAKMMLESLGYTVLTAASPREAMNLAREHGKEVHLLMTDVIMPEMNGRDLAGKLLSLYPDLKWLFMSGYTEDIIAHHGVLDDGVNFIQKPFSIKELSMKIRKSLEENE